MKKTDMKKTGMKKQLNNIAGRLLSVLLSVLMVLPVFAASGCTSTKKVEDYPMPVMETAKEDESEEENDLEGEKEKEEDTSDEELFMDEYDSLKEKGRYEFNPTALHPLYKQEMKGNAKVIRTA